MSTPPNALKATRRFTVTVAEGLLTDEQAHEVEAAIQKAVADQIASLNLSNHVQLVDPVKEMASQGPAKGTDWLSVLSRPLVTTGMVAVLSSFGPPAPSE